MKPSPHDSWRALMALPQYCQYAMPPDWMLDSGEDEAEWILTGYPVDLHLAMLAQILDERRARVEGWERKHARFVAEHGAAVVKKWGESARRKKGKVVKGGYIKAGEKGASV